MRRPLASRRAVLGAALAAAAGATRLSTGAQGGRLSFAYPIALDGRLPGDGFLIRHGYACENTWYNPGWWHTGEDWYRIDGDTAGAGVLAVAAGDVVFAGSDYPGRVVIVQHGPDLYSMYGHLDYALGVGVGGRVERGQLLGTVLARTDGRAPSHLHFEVRTFLTTPEVNGDAPRYGYGCGFQCPPGPGYWPIDAPEHPSAMGWRNPTHAIARRTFPDRLAAPGAEVSVASGASATVAVWSTPPDSEGAREAGELALAAGVRFPVLAVDAGSEASEGTSADAYRLWYRIELPEGGSGWIQAAVPSTNDTGSDGRPSSVVFTLLPAFPTA